MPRTLDWSSLSLGRDKAARRLTAERTPPFAFPVWPWPRLNLTMMPSQHVAKVKLFFAEPRRAP